MQYKSKIITVVSLLVLVGALIGVSAWIDSKNENEVGVLDDFAKCLGEKGAKFYGAFWCSHCNNQKKLFGSSKKFLPYIECSLPDGSGQTAECTKLDIKSYPTWIFSDGSKENGEVPLIKLAEKTSCSLPELSK